MSYELDGLIEDLPDEDIPADPQEAIDLYEMGSKPRCEEAEYLDLLNEAIVGIDGDAS